MHYNPENVAFITAKELSHKWKCHICYKENNSYKDLHEKIVQLYIMQSIQYTEYNKTYHLNFTI